MSYQPLLTAPTHPAYTGRPPSLLSPTPQHMAPEYWSSPSEDGLVPSQKRKNVSKRGYRACLHCRMRKAKCDLGDTDAPSKPPCSRCRREMRNCVFLPTKRRKNRVDPTDEYAQVYPAHSDSAIHTRFDPEYPGQSPFEAVTSPAYPHVADLQPRSSIATYYDAFGTCGANCPSPTHRRQSPATQTVQALPSLLSPSLPPRQPKYHGHDAPSKILAADLTNETDALEILATAAATESKDETVSPASDKPVSLNEFSLVKRGLVPAQDVVTLVNEYFENYHPYLPIFQTYRIPKNETEIAQLSSNDPFLLSSLILVASRHHPQKRGIHDKVWPVMRQSMTDYALSGLPASIGLIEGMLILAEYLPRDQPSVVESSAELVGHNGDTTALIEGIESRRTWALIGMAIRAAYALGLDSIAMDIPKDRPAWKERARCLAFWTRAPQISFVGMSNISQSGEAAAQHSFPTMLRETNKGNDDACFMQALMELTEIMTTAHDMLYPSKGRTARLIRQGTYSKFCDDFSHALNLYKKTWGGKKWDNPNLRIIEFCTYHMVRLYVSSFCFQAHVTRAHTRGDASDGSPIQLFPRGLSSSPDAVYIYESIDAADQILQICLELGSAGQLAYVPSRFWINFVYAGVFALKAAHSGATSAQQTIETRRLVDRVCTTLLECSSAPDHPTKRYGNKLRLLASKFVPPDSSTSGTGESTSSLTTLTTAIPSNDPFILQPLSDVADPQPSAFSFSGTGFDLDGFLGDYTLLGENSGVPNL